MKSKGILLIVWAVMIAAIIMLIIPSGKNEYLENRTVNSDYIQYSPDGVLSYMSVEDVLTSREPQTVWTEVPCTDWERFAFFCDSAFTCSEYELFGLKGTMTYYFDSMDRLSYSCFRVDNISADPDAVYRLTKELTQKYGGCLSGSGMDDEAYGEYHREYKCYYVITPGRGDWNNCRDWEYITTFHDEDTDTLYVYQFGWGIDPIPEGTGLCSINDLYDTFSRRESPQN